jgi:hypothetical protein
MLTWNCNAREVSTCVMRQYPMSIESHSVYRNNDVDDNLLVNSYFSNVLEDNERTATNTYVHVRWFVFDRDCVLPLQPIVDRFSRLNVKFLIHNHRQVCQHPISMPENATINGIRTRHVYLPILSAYIQLV